MRERWKKRLFSAAGVCTRPNTDNNKNIGTYIGRVRLSGRKSFPVSPVQFMNPDHIKIKDKLGT